MTTIHINGVPVQLSRTGDRWIATIGHDVLSVWAADVGVALGTAVRLLWLVPRHASNVAA